MQLESLLKKSKTCTVFLLSYRNTSGSLGEQKLLWKHELQVSVFTALFEFFQTFTTLVACFHRPPNCWNPNFFVPFQTNVERYLVSVSVVATGKLLHGAGLISGLSTDKWPLFYNKGLTSEDRELDRL